MKRNLVSNYRQPTRGVGSRGFTRVDLCVVLATLLFLGAWIGCCFFGERGRIARCAHNLSSLSRAMHQYANEHGHALPPAIVNLDKYQTTWDLELTSYLKSGIARDDFEKMARVIPPMFCCPSDKVDRSGPPRSYAMANNDMSIKNWPPGKDAATGVGLCWDKQTVATLFKEDAPKDPKSLPGIKLSEIPSPSETLLLTEFVNPDNILGKAQCATVSGVGQQNQGLADGVGQFHRAKFNYLMADGHVELLSFLQTGAYDGSGGIWTLKKRN